MSKRVYTAGPMTGYPNYNWIMFEAAASFMRRKGWDAVSPTQIDEDMGVVDVVRSPEGDILSVKANANFDYETVLLRDLEAVSSCDAILLLPYWHKSPGAKRELAHAILNELEVILYREVFLDSVVG